MMEEPCGGWGVCVCVCMGGVCRMRGIIPMPQRQTERPGKTQELQHQNKQDR